MKLTRICKIRPLRTTALFSQGFQVLFLLIFCLLGHTVMAQTPSSPMDNAYRLGAGDTVRIQVFGEDDLTFSVRLTETGAINYPFLGQIEVTGKTASELQQLIANGLRGDYLIDPKVTVTIADYRKIFVNGEVKRPGGFPFQPGLTVQKAISLAEGFTERASRKGIVVISEDDASRQEKKVSLTDPVHPGDIITVKQSFF